MSVAKADETQAMVCDGGSQSVSSIGSSNSSLDGRVHAAALFQTFALLKCNVDVATMTAQDFCRVEVMEAFMSFAVHTFKQSNGNPLAKNTLLTYFSHIMVEGRKKFGGLQADAYVTEFFAVLDAPPNSPATWYSRLRKNATRAILTRCIENGDPIVDSATPIAGVAVKEVAFALLKMGTIGTLDV
jgi:hypothetical protein